jgi:uncharacterized protein YjbJ (UPF0337 family)
MAEATAQIREAIEKARSEAADAVGALGQTGEVTKHLADAARGKGSQAKEQLADYAAQAVSKASDLRDQAVDHVPDRVGPAIGDAVDQARGAAASATRDRGHRWLVAASFLVVVLAVIMVRRMRGSE